ncbi:MAG: serine hydroxymethyltransferase [Candidatus ainarchaeum sp.]|nr:serine hydroxymethyltransferase [Candidatus ainarchaeum sp.]
MLNSSDPEIHKLIVDEVQKQRDTIDLIASENYSSEAVIQAMGSPLTNKYAEGYPGKRYYAGNQYIDQIESLAIERAKKLFKVGHANVQPHAGAVANLATYFAFMELGDTFMGLELSQGGHLTHGSPVNFSGKWYKVVPYHVEKETGTLDYDKIKKQAIETKPKLIVAGYTAYPREIDYKAFREICDACGAYLMADISHFAGLVAAEVISSPAPYADVITSTTHKTLRGPRGAIILSKEEHASKIDKALFPGIQGGPLEHVIAAKAVCFKEASTPEFKEYAKQIIKNAKALGEELSSLGFELVSGGTDTHLLLVDLTNKGITGKDAQFALEEAGIIANRNTVPYDQRSPFITSGIRLGSAACATRGMKESDMKVIAEFISRVLSNTTNSELKSKVKEEVKAFCNQFPLYANYKV